MMNSVIKAFPLHSAVGAAVLCALWMSVGDVRAETNKVEYELAERCGEAAADWFKRNWGKTASGEEASFENHYSPRAKKCYVVLRYALPRREPPLLVLHLFDIGASRELGLFSRTGAGAPSQCEAMETACTSEQEWRDLARRLVEE
jgi:hypothetical protein